MQKYMTQKQFVNFKQWQWSIVFTTSLIALLVASQPYLWFLVGAFGLLKCAKWGVFDTE